MPTPTAASLRGLAVVDGNCIWIGGAKGTLLRTVDGGQTWLDVAPAGSQGCDFRDIAAFDAHCALAMVAGQPARIYRTIDAGRSWQVVHEDPRPTAFFDAMAFRGDDGVLLGDPIDGAFCVLVSRDAGRTWRPLPTDQLPAPMVGEAAFAASGTCVAVRPGRSGSMPCAVTGGSQARLLLWDLQTGVSSTSTLPLQHGGSAQGAFSIAFRDRGLSPAHGVVVGGDYEKPHDSDGTAAWTVDGGVTWHAVAGGAGGYRSAVVWLDERHVLAVGSHGASLSLDGGRSFRSFGELGFHSLAVGGDGAVFACGSDGRLSRFTPAR